MAKINLEKWQDSLPRTRTIKTGVDHDRPPEKSCGLLCRLRAYVVFPAYVALWRMLSSNPAAWMSSYGRNENVRRLARVILQEVQNRRQLTPGRVPCSRPLSRSTSVTWQQTLRFHGHGSTPGAKSHKANVLSPRTVYPTPLGLVGFCAKAKAERPSWTFRPVLQEVRKPIQLRDDGTSSLPHPANLCPAASGCSVQASG